MTRFLTVPTLLLCLMPTSTAYSQTPKKDPTIRREQNAMIVSLLEGPVKTNKLQDVTLKDALEYYSDILRGRALDLRAALDKDPLFLDGVIPIIVNKSAFLADADLDTPDPYTEKVTLPVIPEKMSLHLALDLTLSQIGKSPSTFLVRKGHLEIVPRKYATAGHLLTNSTVLLSFKAERLPEVLHDLGDETGLAIHLDPNVGKKAKMPISATFRNASLEDALVTVTEMAGLKFVIMERSIYVTTPSRAEAIRREAEERAKARKVIEPRAKALEPAK